MTDAEEFAALRDLIHSEPMWVAGGIPADEYMAGRCAGHNELLGRLRAITEPVDVSPA